MATLNIVDNIETSAICDNDCLYCPAQKQKDHRPVGLMEMDTFMKAIKVVDYCVAKGTQRQLNMYAIGEPMLNPYIYDMLQIARAHLPEKFSVHLNTNGNLITEEVALRLKAAGVTAVDVTAHDPKVTARAVQILRRLRIFGCVSIAFMEQPNNWAGQVDWFESDCCYPCPYLHFGQVMIMWDGRITRCSIDAFAQGVIGTVSEDFTKFEWGPFELCKTCHQLPPGDPRMQPGMIDKDTGGMKGWFKY